MKQRYTIEEKFEEWENVFETLGYFEVGLRDVIAGTDDDDPSMKSDIERLSKIEKAQLFLVHVMKRHTRSTKPKEEKK